MGRSIFRQETQIRKSDTYDDTVVPSLANYETNPADLEDDLNTLRSAVQNMINRSGASFPSGNWYDDLTAPSTFENGTQRGVDAVNSDLHDLERKRVLVTAYNLEDITVPSDVEATGTLTASSNFGNGETVTIDTKVYTFETSLTNVDGNVQIGGTLTASLLNLLNAINLTGTPGTDYAALMTIHPTVTSTASDATTLSAEAKLGGTQGNLIATTASGGASSAAWGAATLTGGAGDAVILALSEIPTQTTAAIGAVTTLGTVAAYNALFGNVSLALVAGTNALTPKNLGYIEDTTTHDPILSGGRIVYVLFQTESNTDGSTMSGTTPNRAQLSFVRINTGGTALEFVPSTDIAGLTVHYSSNARKGLDDLNEQDFLRGAVIDIPASVTVTRQIGYDNQGTSPVDLITNAILDLEGAGLVWKIRDDLQADLFVITEGSAGGTSVIQIGGDVDTFDVNAVVNDFLNGASFDSGAAGTKINVGVTANQIDSGGTLDLVTAAASQLKLASGGRLAFTDTYEPAGWSLDGIALSDSAQEWTDFETAFGEVSILNAIKKAYESAHRRRVFSVVTAANIAANNNASGPSDDNNLDTDLGDLSGGTFVDDYDVYLNGQLLRPGVDAAANNDYYPGTALANGQLKFEFVLKINDQLCVVDHVA